MCTRLFLSYIMCISLLENNTDNIIRTYISSEATWARSRFYVVEGKKKDTELTTSSILIPIPIKQGSRVDRYILHNPLADEESAWGSAKFAHVFNGLLAFQEQQRNTIGPFLSLYLSSLLLLLLLRLLFARQKLTCRYSSCGSRRKVDSWHFRGFIRRWEIETV